MTTVETCRVERLADVYDTMANRPVSAPDYRVEKAAAFRAWRRAEADLRLATLRRKVEDAMGRYRAAESVQAWDEYLRLGIELTRETDAEKARRRGC